MINSLYHLNSKDNIYTKPSWNLLYLSTSGQNPKNRVLNIYNYVPCLKKTCLQVDEDTLITIATILQVSSYDNVIYEVYQN